MADADGRDASQLESPFRVPAGATPVQARIIVYDAIVRWASIASGQNDRRRGEAVGGCNVRVPTIERFQPADRLVDFDVWCKNRQANRPPYRRYPDRHLRVSVRKYRGEPDERVTFRDVTDNKPAAKPGV